MALTAVGCLLGCASSEIRLAAPLGPRPGVAAEAENLGALEVFTARQPVVDDVNFEEFFAGDGFLKDCEDPAHTDYTLCSQDGKSLRRVKNSTHPQDEQPNLLRLAPGNYRVRAQSEGPDGMRATVVVPVRIEAGRTTRVHLLAPWTPNQALAGGDLVRLPNGQPVGWRATGPNDNIHNPDSDDER